MRWMEESLEAARLRPEDPVLSLFLPLDFPHVDTFHSMLYPILDKQIPDLLSFGVVC